MKNTNLKGTWGNANFFDFSANRGIFIWSELMNMEGYLLDCLADSMAKFC